jgi:hypothetical protein
MNTANNVQIIEITPQLAESFLEKNTSNRPLSLRTINELAQAMENDEWQVNGEAIKFDIQGNLIDGQHRLKAIIKSNQPIRTFVLRDLSADSFKTLDTGKKRGNADTLSILGFNNPALLAASSRFVFNFQASQLRSNKVVSNLQMEDFIARNPEICLSIDFIKEIKAESLFPGAVAAGLHFLMCKSDRDDAELFFRDLAKGSMLGATDPVFLLRERLLYYKNRVGSRLSRRELVAHIIKAWNYRRTGKIVKRLKWAKKTGEEFPVIR